MASSEWKRIGRFFLSLNISWIVFPALVAAALSVMGFQRFIPAYVMLGIAGLWLQAHWLFSPFLQEKFRKAKRRRNHSYKEAIQWIIWVSALIITLCLGAEYWVYEIQMGYQQDDVSKNLTIAPSMSAGKDAIDTTFTITNGGSFPISAQHRVACIIKSLYLENLQSGKLIEEQNMIFTQTQDGGWDLISGGIGVLDRNPMQNSTEIQPGGDSQTDSCLNLFRFLGTKTVCVDMALRFEYFITTQIGSLQKKEVRFIYGGNSGDMSWIRQPVGSKNDYCSMYRSRFEQQRREGQLLQRQNITPLRPADAPTIGQPGV